ncbi:MAG: homocysteine S-methyltransferase [Halioglobus sp.]|nr:homocysteine S-methyltransferase [Halioglobus sp.]
MTDTGQILPQLAGVVCLTDGGLETDLCFNHGIDLPQFAAYDLLRTPQGRQLLLDYYREYVAIARRHDLGLVLETPTWRANPDWAALIGDDAPELDRLNRVAVALVRELREELEGAGPTLVVSGCIGPRGDGYTPDLLMSPEQARDYHRAQVASFAGGGVDMVSALTLNYVDEAVGIALAAAESGLPLGLSFTVETDGRLPTGEELRQAIDAVDAATDAYPAYYMINCAHPTHFDHLFQGDAAWLQRVMGLRGNASCMSHEELDNAQTLDDGDPNAFGAQLHALRRAAPWMTVLGGCCGTDTRHIEQVARRLSRAA